MKNIKKIIFGIICAYALISCDNPINLGSKLDLDGPVVNFTSPVPRKVVTPPFILEGTVSDNSGISKMLVNIKREGVELARQWRNTGGKWEISNNSGATWTSFSDAKWEGGKSVIWSINVDMNIDGVEPEDGQYMFCVQAWDSADMSDDNSFKTLILIIDTHPPLVSINKPLLYNRLLDYDSAADKFGNGDEEGKELEALRKLVDWKNPELIGKFQTNSFEVQWSIEENFNIWSFDLRFYGMEAKIDEDAGTPLPDDYIYRYYQNDSPIPDNPSPSQYLKPNGKVTIPALDGSVASSGLNWELKNPISKNNTTIRVVAVCTDAASKVTQERTLGYFIYWADADIPWITFSGDLKDPTYYNSLPTAGRFDLNANDNAFLVYPGVRIKAIAFHAQGVERVTYSIKKIDTLGTTYAGSTTSILVPNTKLENPLQSRGKFDWEFMPEPRTAVYVVEAVTTSTGGKTSAPVLGVFKVQDITFPDFPQPVEPPALEPLFQHITSDSITIRGVVSDATEVDSLCLVWINPQSKGFAAMSQLDYFRDSNYGGWNTAINLPANGTFAEEGLHDPANKNKVWKLLPVLKTASPNSLAGVNPNTQRVEYTFSKNIPLSQLNISTGGQSLKSQVFLLRAANKAPRVTVITYTPQGDEAPPKIEIKSVVIGDKQLTPGQFGQIDKFKTGDNIVINGTWNEDSVKYLAFNTYLRNNFKISINDIPVPAGNLTFTGTSLNDNGTWQATARVGTTPGLDLSVLKDTLVVSASLKDIGGNSADDGASWLIESDTLRLVRISSELADQTYNRDKNIEIFLEFNKPVRLKNSVNPVLTLRVGESANITAAYRTNPVQTNQNTRQYFTYTVASGQNTSTANPWLDVIGLNGLAGGNYWEAANYPFTWVAGSEEIRVTMSTAHTEAANLNYNGALLRRLPVIANTQDANYTLARGKNIGIDTTAPTVVSISSSNKAAHYALDADIDISVTFSEAVKIADEANLPRLNLQVTNGANTTVQTSNAAGSVKVNDRTVTFTYKVKANDTTGDNKVIVASFAGGQIQDIAGTNMAVMSLNEANRTLNGGGNGTGIYINTVAPGVPIFRALSANNNGTNPAIISNTISGTPVTGESATATVKTLQNYYGDELWFAINANTTGGNNRFGYFEYSLDPSTVTTPINWKRIDSTTTTGVPFKQDIYGSYYVRVRQIDKAGNVSPTSSAVSLNWDPGNLVTRIDSSSANGTYTNNSPATPARADTVNVTVYFRKPLTVTASTITLNALRGGNAVTVSSTSSSSDSLSFSYAIANNDNTPAGTGRAQYLDVTAFSITARDAQNVDVTTANGLIKAANTLANDNRLGYRKDLLVQTGALTVASGPTWSNTSTANDEFTGTLTYTFNRSISKRSGEVSIKQQTAGYRLPAVLTEAQANRYKSARNFNANYSRGTNGFVNGAVDTSTKYVLDYGETTVVTPTNAGTAQQQMAYDFLTAENVTLPVSSQDVTVDGNTLTIKLTGSNALQVLGAAYDINIPAGFVQDGLSYQSALLTPTYTTPSINRPFVRIDKKVNADRITASTANVTTPHLMANFGNLIQTRARLDCRTPNSIVRFAAVGEAYAATGVDSYGSRNGQNWKNTANNADSTNLLTEQTLAANGAVGTQVSTATAPANGTTYYTNTFTTPDLLTVGTAATTNPDNVSGYVWRISVMSRNSATTNTSNSALYEEIAFRTVLTYQLDGLTVNNEGQRLGEGDQLWIRGGDAIGSSSVPGFPINWQDDYGKLKTDGKRAGIRLLQRVSATTNVNTTSVWRWVTWEINVRTWHDVVLARGTAVGTAQNVNDAWQYGPRQWAYKRGGWAALKDEYTLYPGKHRWVRITNDATYQPGGLVNFSLQFSTRGDQGTPTLTQPNP